MNIFLWKSSFHQNLFNIPGDCKNLKLFVKLSKVCHFLLETTSQWTFAIIISETSPLSSCHV